MKVLIQRVASASVQVGDDKVAQIGQGLLVYLGITEGDDDQKIVAMVDKLLHVRIFPNEDGTKSFHTSLMEQQTSILVVSQFTLYGSLQKGRRPSFDKAMEPSRAEKVYELFLDELRRKYPIGDIASGMFGEHMMVEACNDGPVNFIYEL